MKNILKYFYLPFAFVLCGILFFSFRTDHSAKFKFPYKSVGLTEREAAAHLLNRFTYGTRPGDIDAVLKMGLEKWFLQQLDGKISDDFLNDKLSSFDALNLSNSEVVKLYPKNAQVLRLAIQDGVLNKDSVNLSDRKQYRGQIQAYMNQKGFKPEADLYRQLISQKILRAVYSKNQLHEVLTDFWFNHFNVSITKNICAEYIPAYERDVIRPNLVGNFEDLLFATARSPAMLFYLDNFSSSGSTENIAVLVNNQMRKQIAARANRQELDPSSPQAKALEKVKQNRKSQGLNENYAREVMELHTLGVDGGYTQSDVTQAARILTGWTVNPMENAYGAPVRKMIEKVGEENLKKRGFYMDGDFLFAANRHDPAEKVILGRTFPANGGYEEGVELLKMLANHPSTSKFISRKLAVRFVNDEPSEKLIEKMALAFNNNNGNISAVLISMVSSPEFWSTNALREKTKSPFELAISAVRGLNAEVNQAFQLNNWISKMGQKMYYYQAPTGFPDRGQYWINTGSLLSRMNFGLALASGKIPGIKTDLPEMNKNREPESAEAALRTYSKLIMPERDLEKTIVRLSPMLNDPLLSSKVEEAASKNQNPQNEKSMMNEGAAIQNESPSDEIMSNSKTAPMKSPASNTMLAQVVGVILGSPEFQRK